MGVSASAHVATALPCQLGAQPRAELHAVPKDETKHALRVRQLSLASVLSGVARGSSQGSDFPPLSGPALARGPPHQQPAPALAPLLAAAPPALPAPRPFLPAAAPPALLAPLALPGPQSLLPRSLRLVLPLPADPQGLCSLASAVESPVLGAAQAAPAGPQPPAFPLAPLTPAVRALELLPQAQGCCCAACRGPAAAPPSAAAAAVAEPAAAAAAAARAGEAVGVAGCKSAVVAAGVH